MGGQEHIKLWEGNKSTMKDFNKKEDELFDKEFRFVSWTDHNNESYNDLVKEHIRERDSRLIDMILEKVRKLLLPQISRSANNTYNQALSDIEQELIKIKEE